MTSEPSPAAARTSITAAAEAGSPGLRSLIQEQYDSLLDLAEQVHRQQGAGAVHSPASLVHEAFLRLVDQPRVTARGKLFFRACIAQEYRRIQIDAIRRRRALRRGGGAQHESFADQSGLSTSGTMDLFAVHDAMEELARHDARLAQVADLRLFGQLTIEEIAEVVGLSPRQIDSDWAFARSWLQRRIG